MPAAPNGEVSSEDEMQGDHAGGITTVPRAGTDAVTMVMVTVVMESWGR